ncbi:hypothetical protein [Paenibacillus sp. CF384]|uniref:WD40/YVTN/BNR-like repeat-containing protein n=1 Tax=Paenibacillus sp. CF384 TaxID=1884382 RepID=UPI00089721BF|nr:hypothetical protein [Paenibacillus sp. CF384]SDX33214.1 Uncharacterized protein SAMN05518855_101292 [Paenibacillus sp. CF384]
MRRGRRVAMWVMAVLLGTSLLVPAAYNASAQAAAPAPEASAACRTDNHGLNLQAMTDTSAPHIQAIQFLGATIGRAAGNGFMIGTSDGGCHWQAIYNTGKLSFSQMEFLTNSVGYVLAKTSATKQNTLLKTTNGGADYTWVPTGQYGFERIDFLNEQVGYGFTRAYTFKTNNGGKTWTKVATPPNSRYVHFVTEAKGWVITVLAAGGYEVKRTIDGGRHWTDFLKVKATVNYGGAIYGTDSSDIWVMLYGDSGMSQTSYSLFHTTDAGAHWKQVISHPTAGGGPAPGPVAPAGTLAGPAGSPTDMAVIGRKGAFLAAGSGALDNLQFGRSLDDGKTWSNLPIAVPGYEGKLSFVSPTTGYLAVTSLSKSGVYRTVDGGKTWTKRFSLPEPQ